MKILIKSARIIDSKSKFNDSVFDVLIQDGIIQAIEQHIAAPDAILIEAENLHISRGWVDLKADFCDPGFEHKESIESGLEAASFGGFTHVAVVPGTNPIVDGKTSIEYLLRKSENQVASIHPIGSISQGMHGENLAELYDMQQAGAVFFSDDTHTLSAGLAYRALLYAKNIDAGIVLFSRDSSLTKGSQVNEGEASLKTGLKADPAIAEVIQLERNLKLLEYTDSKLHLTGISSAESVELIAAAKKKGLHVTADVHVEQLLFNETEVLDFDQNFKLLPVLRTEKDRLALIAGVKSGTIDGIVSNHRPNDEEEKEVEFDHASFGNITLQTFFSSLRTKNELNLTEIVEILSTRNRQLLGLELEGISIGLKADLTLFNPDKKWIFSSENCISKTKNSPFMNKELSGRVVGIINNGKLALVE